MGEFADDALKLLRKSDVSRTRNRLPNNPIIARLYHERIKARMTRKELAEKSGYSEGTLKLLETGRVNPRLSTIQDLAQIFGLRLVLKRDSEKYREAAKTRTQSPQWRKKYARARWKLRDPWLVSLSDREEILYKKMLKSRGDHETVEDVRSKLSKDSPVPINKSHLPVPCLGCGEDAGYIRVHGHIQCRRCNFIVERCCD